MQELHPGVIKQLAQQSKAVRDTFLDMAFIRKKRQRTGGVACRQWYVSVDNWIAGTLAASAAAPSFFDEEVSMAAPAKGMGRLLGAAKGYCGIHGLLMRSLVKSSACLLCLYDIASTCIVKQPIRTSEPCFAFSKLQRGFAVGACVPQMQSAMQNAVHGMHTQTATCVSQRLAWPCCSSTAPSRRLSFHIYNIMAIPCCFVCRFRRLKLSQLNLNRSLRSLKTLISLFVPSAENPLTNTTTRTKMTGTTGMLNAFMVMRLLVMVWLMVPLSMSNV